jgi:hypothetical protein
MDRLPQHLDKTELFCTKCGRYINKFTETMPHGDHLHCLHCDNWLCPTWEAFGDLGESRYNGLITKGIFIPRFIKIIMRKLWTELPYTPLTETEMLQRSWGILQDSLKHILSALT